MPFNKEFLKNTSNVIDQSDQNVQVSGVVSFLATGAADCISN